MLNQEKDYPLHSNLGSNRKFGFTTAESSFSAPILHVPIYEF